MMANGKQTRLWWFYCRNFGGEGKDMVEDRSCCAAEATGREGGADVAFCWHDICV
jgi:hypothetical protein